MVRNCRVRVFKNLTCPRISRRRTYGHEAVDNTGAAIQSSENLVWLRSRDFRLDEIASMVGIARKKAFPAEILWCPWLTISHMFWRNANLTKLNFQELSEILPAICTSHSLGETIRAMAGRRINKNWTSDRFLHRGNRWFSTWQLRLGGLDECWMILFL